MIQDPVFKKVFVSLLLCVGIAAIVPRPAFADDSDPFPQLSAEADAAAEKAASMTAGLDKKSAAFADVVNSQEYKIAVGTYNRASDALQEYFARQVDKAVRISDPVQRAAYLKKLAEQAQGVGGEGLKDIVCGTAENLNTNLSAEEIKAALKRAFPYSPELRLGSGLTDEQKYSYYSAKLRSAKKLGLRYEAGQAKTKLESLRKSIPADKLADLDRKIAEEAQCNAELANCKKAVAEVVTDEEKIKKLVSDWGFSSPEKAIEFANAFESTPENLRKNTVVDDLPLNDKTFYKAAKEIRELYNKKQAAEQVARESPCLEPPKPKEECVDLPPNDVYKNLAALRDAANEKAKQLGSLFKNESIIDADSAIQAYENFRKAGNLTAEQQKLFAALKQFQENYFADYGKAEGASNPGPCELTSEQEKKIIQDMHKATQKRAAASYEQSQARLKGVVGEQNKVLAELDRKIANLDAKIARSTELLAEQDAAKKACATACANAREEMAAVKQAAARMGQAGRAVRDTREAYLLLIPKRPPRQLLATALENYSRASSEYKDAADALRAVKVSCAAARAEAANAAARQLAVMSDEFKAAVADFNAAKDAYFEYLASGPSGPGIGLKLDPELREQLRLNFEAGAKEIELLRGAEDPLAAEALAAGTNFSVSEAAKALEQLSSIEVETWKWMSPQAAAMRAEIALNAELEAEAMKGALLPKLIEGLDVEIPGLTKVTIGRALSGLFNIWIAFDLAKNFGLSVYARSITNENFHGEINSDTEKIALQTKRLLELWEQYKTAVTLQAKIVSCGGTVIPNADDILAHMIDIRKIIDALLQDIVNVSIAYEMQHDDSYKKTVSGVIGETTNYEYTDVGFLSDKRYSNEYRTEIMGKVKGIWNSYFNSEKINWLGGEELMHEVPPEKAKINAYIKPVQDALGDALFNLLYGIGGQQENSPLRSVIDQAIQNGAINCESAKKEAAKETCPNVPSCNIAPYCENPTPTPQQSNTPSGGECYQGSDPCKAAGDLAPESLTLQYSRDVTGRNLTSADKDVLRDSIRNALKNGKWSSERFGVESISCRNSSVPSGTACTDISDPDGLKPYLNIQYVTSSGKVRIVWTCYVDPRGKGSQNCSLPPDNLCTAAQLPRQCAAGTGAAEGAQGPVGASGPQGAAGASAEQPVSVTTPPDVAAVLARLQPGMNLPALEAIADAAGTPVVQPSLRFTANDALQACFTPLNNGEAITEAPVVSRSGLLGLFSQKTSGAVSGGAGCVPAGNLAGATITFKIVRSGGAVPPPNNAQQPPPPSAGGGKAVYDFGNAFNGLPTSLAEDGLHVSNAGRDAQIGSGAVDMEPDATPGDEPDDGGSGIARMSPLKLNLLRLQPAPQIYVSVWGGRNRGSWSILNGMFNLSVAIPANQLTPVSLNAVSPEGYDWIRVAVSGTPLTITRDHLSGKGEFSGGQVEDYPVTQHYVPPPIHPPAHPPGPGAGGFGAVK